MKNTYLIITSIANSNHPVLKKYAEESSLHNVPFIVVGDTKSPTEFELKGCDFYSIERQKRLPFKISEILPYKHYARKNIGYLVAISKGAEVIIETDDDNYPLAGFWEDRKKESTAYQLLDKGWVNIYKYFTDLNIWPRGFALENLQDKLPPLEKKITIECQIQQGLADENPDVDAIYRLVLPLPVSFKKSENIALGNNTVCPFNSQNTTWFKEAFPLLYLPSYCSFRMTDIWRSFVAQRIAWTCGWNLLFHRSTVWQERNEHNLMIDFRDEISGYLNNSAIYQSLAELDLKNGSQHLLNNLRLCYEKLVSINLIGNDELPLVHAWIEDMDKIL
jgi:hypothetical protein